MIDARISVAPSSLGARQSLIYIGFRQCANLDIFNETGEFNAQEKTALEWPASRAVCETTGASVMKSVTEFNEQQQEDFRLIADDAVGPTMVSYVLSTLEQVAYSLAQPDLDPTWIDKEPREKYEVCMAALEYLRMSDFASRKTKG